MCTESTECTQVSHLIFKSYTGQSALLLIVFWKIVLLRKQVKSRKLNPSISVSLVFLANNIPYLIKQHFFFTVLSLVTRPYNDHVMIQAVLLFYPNDAVLIVI